MVVGGGEGFDAVIRVAAVPPLVAGCAMALPDAALTGRLCECELTREKLKSGGLENADFGLGLVKTNLQAAARL